MNRFAKLGASALRIYTTHILVFTVGAICGAIEAMLIMLALYGAVPS